MPDWGAYAIRPYPDGPKKQDHFLNPCVFGVILTDEKNEPREHRGSKNVAVRITTPQCGFKKWGCRAEGGDHFLSRLKTDLGPSTAAVLVIVSVSPSRL